jgi:hypothetical protein
LDYSWVFCYRSIGDLGEFNLPQKKKGCLISKTPFSPFFWLPKHPQNYKSVQITFCSFLLPAEAGSYLSHSDISALLTSSFVRKLLILFFFDLCAACVGTKTVACFAWGKRAWFPVTEVSIHQIGRTFYFLLLDVP